ncbi:dihydrolipoamide acetyltransferase component of pyruvate dehydrogenase complex [Capnocytophaga catalasegens]|uniref:Dihydrolipoamide acetyltransferase component of pyruvate dehydrogenase complex n=1 Tax=Capnocytophaga catalasegens TaxID=1004260 RepID=A0AAV5AS60_9FLAO|nr:pyruvate dehydrogenase complex dihydrolipoamide acetyltransferase [Capnocytophaga catalasegens]GIZ14965.1 dihydrolipoamide acetyltransferase component of pyruvate dehydrogenase complex [Capnocytophaga catalasegens]GJM49344.1 dihydrolipoamide acetyltransferase component of pyruvate dehydrogenase complex [Capnocytophaga catalasegens]GJM52495.1 dihydrolipoamide acetyltransferase component of pyruvate dehydrogenase complex [Capnocytophaga catalasegens]
MAEIVNMPRLSDTMEEGVVAKWLKKVGDKVNEGDILAEIETDKATMEFESFHSGILLYIGLKEGETAPVDSLLAIIGKEGEDISALIGGSASSAPKVETLPTETLAKEEKLDQSVAAPAGVEIVTMPRLSDTMTEGTVATWLKKVGDKVNEGDILAEIETDKATMEFESFHSGTLLYIGIKEGESAPVDSLLAIIGPAGTDVSALVAGGAKPVATPVSSEVKTETKQESTSVATPINDVNGRVFASPLAKKIAQDKGINLSQIKGTGENGRITKKDVEGFTPSVSASVSVESKTSAVVTPFVPTGQEAIQEVKNSQMRKTIAKRLSESKFTAPHYYLTIEIDMDNAMASRTQINNLPDTKISFNDMVVKACAMALKKHPQVNTSWKGDITLYNQHVHIGVAVAVEDGLVVPVLRFTDAMSLTQIGTQVKDLAGRARNKKLTPAEMEGSTFTVSNLGMFGIEEFTSIINQPNSAILSVGAIVEKPVVKQGQIVIGHTMKVTLACDHRTVDGATGAQFLQTLKSFVENPVTMLA